MCVPRLATRSKPRETVTVGVISPGLQNRAGAEGEGKLFDRSELMRLPLSVAASKDPDK